MIRKRSISGFIKNKKRKYPLFFATFFFGIIACIVVVFVFFILTLQKLPSPENFGERSINQTTKLYDRTGKILIYEIHGDEKRTIVPFSEIPEIVKKATLAAEDNDFYTQPAFDLKAIARAMWNNIKSGEITQGGSTITQQLVKKTLLSDERTYTRKIKELILAIQLESKYSKDEIFGFYLNQIPYGSTAYGIESASQLYFNKSVKDITVSEAALLAGMIKAPSYFSPWGSHKQELFARRDYVLSRMEDVGYINKETAELAKKEKLSFAPPSLGKIIAPHFTLAVRDYLVQKYGETLVMNGGLKVITTLDVKLQTLAEQVVKDGAEKNSKAYGGTNAALIAQDPKTGQILTLVGSKDYFADAEPKGCAAGVSCLFDGNFNVAIQGQRQPGSALKPFVYLTAFSRGFSPKTVLFDVETEFDTRGVPEYSYRPKNFDGEFRGPVFMEQALAQSLNVPAVKTLYLVGLDSVIKNLTSFGITTLKDKSRYGLTLTLGGGEVRPIELVKAYSVLSQEGVLHEQTVILKIETSNGEVLEEYKDKSERVFDETYVREINSILSNTELRSPIFQSSLGLTYFDGYDVALKTGTTQDYRDAWAFGYTPNLVIGVWAGNNNNTAMHSQGSSILAAIPMWNAFLKDALKQFEPEFFTKNESLQLPEKPMLNGEWRSSYGIHSLLHFVDKNNPQGPIPTEPWNDSQYQNWEDAVSAWAKGSGLPLKQLGSSYSFSGPIGITYMEPKTGSFLRSPLVIKGKIVSPNVELQQVELYVNKNKIQSFPISGNAYVYSFNYSGSLESQNIFELKAKNVSGNEATASTIIYRSQN
ncbi:MAG: 1A family penicillin-binding protein [Parcubacteria group bacterium LiPW_41]|nr:MAG: 1A family penicillin-binding protein [Parcubacteria group bacterium LiPW_41]